MTTYAIICDARKGAELGIDTLALTDRTKAHGDFWTSDDVRLVMRFFNPTVAAKIAGRLRHNNPRVVEYEVARKVIEGQADSIEALATKNTS